MREKPSRRQEYVQEQTNLVRQACLYVATKLGDLMDDLVIVGGLVPTLLVQQDGLPDGVDRHVGTLDLDVGLEVALLEDQRYRDLTDRLRRAGFRQDVNEQGNPTRQRWRVEEPRGASVTIDFLIQPTRPGDRGGLLRDIERDFAAIITPGLHLAFLDRQSVALDGTTLRGEVARRDIWACGPGAYVVLKALAFRARGENKDAYDLHYVLKYFGSGVEDVATRLAPLLGDEQARRALAILRDDFLEHHGLGPRRVAEFISGGQHDDIQADVVGFVRALLTRLQPRAGP